MRIALDAMGSDNCPEPEVFGAVEAARKFGDELTLIGPEDKLREILSGTTSENLPVHIFHTTETITMHDKGRQLTFKAKHKDSKTTMAVGMDMLKSGNADVFVTAGNTGGALATAYFRLGMIPGVKRPAITVLFPVKGGKCAVLDIGANPNCKPEHLLQFAIMGSIYAKQVLDIQNPRVGLISNGEEAGKGNDLVKDTYPILEASGLNFIGNLEGKEIFGGEADVAVTDGFTGNVVLKTSEAVANMFTDILRNELMSSMRTKIGAKLAMPAFNNLKKILDPSEVGAAPLLGIDGLVFIGHGRSDTQSIVSAIRSARQAVNANLINALNSAIEKRIEFLYDQEIQ
jgi:glycerol-3-phosphate acyltransferase PlsX